MHVGRSSSCFFEHTFRLAVSRTPIGRCGRFRQLSFLFEELVDRAAGVNRLLGSSGQGPALDDEVPSLLASFMFRRLADTYEISDIVFV